MLSLKEDQISDPSLLKSPEVMVSNVTPIGSMPFASPVGYELCFIYLSTCLALVSIPPEAEILPWPGIKAIILGEELAFAANIRKLPAFWMLCSAHLLGCPSPIQGFFDTNFTALPVGLVFLLECALDYPLSCPYWVKLQFQTLLSLSFALIFVQS